MSKLGLILDFETFQFRNKAEYLTTNTNLGSTNEVCVLQTVYVVRSRPSMRN